MSYLRNVFCNLLVAFIFSIPFFAAEPQLPQHRIKTIYVVPSSHWDLGFIAPPEQILPRLKPHIDEVIANCKSDPEFRWTIESVWQLREWLARTDDPKRIDELVGLIKKGQIQLSAVWGSTHTEFMSPEQLNRLVYDMKAIERQYGIKADLAMMDDVPGFTSRLPQVLAKSGVKYFVNGSNLFISGGTALWPGKLPFYWQSSDGSRVLTWQTQSKLGGYTEAMADYYIDALSIEPYTKEHFYPKEWEGVPQMEIMQRGVDKLLKQYGDASYPHDAVMLLYLHDFISSSLQKDNLLPSVRAWNAAGKQPRIVVATPAEFFRHLESQNPQFPTYAGDWTGLWSEVKTNSPKITANARWAQDHLPAAEMLWSLLTFREGTSFPAGNFESARINLLKYHEHSGAAQVGWPKLMSRDETDIQNSQYVDYTRNARTEVEKLLSSGLQTLLSQKTDAPGAENIVVFNPLSWTRSEFVDVSASATGSIAVRDLQTGKFVPSQRISSAKVAFLAADVPASGYKTYSLEPVKTPALPHPTPSARNVLENADYRVEIREEDGAVVRIFDKSAGLELLNPKATDKLNSLQRWHWAANFPVSLGRVELTRQDGPLFSRITITRPGSVWPETTITLPREGKRIEFSNTLDRSTMPYVASLQTAEYYSFAFPFSFSGSADVWLENGAGFHRIPDDYLPGARTDAAASQHSMVLTGTASGKQATVVLSHRQSFFSYLPGMPGAKATSNFMNTIKAVAIRKQDQGDTRDLGMVNFDELEPGLENVPLRFDFALTSNAAKPDFVSAYHSGLNLSVPLIAQKLAPHNAPAAPAASFFTIGAPNIVLLAFKPSADGDPNHYTVRLQEIAGQRTETSFTTVLRATQAHETDLTEREPSSQLTLPLTLNFEPNETKTIRLTIPHETKSRSHRWWEW